MKSENCGCWKSGEAFSNIFSRVSASDDGKIEFIFFFMFIAFALEHKTVRSKYSRASETHFLFFFRLTLSAEHLPACVCTLHTLSPLALVRFSREL